MNTKPEPFWLSFLTGILALVIAPAALFLVIYMGVQTMDTKQNLQETAQWQSASSK